LKKSDFVTLINPFTIDHLGKKIFVNTLIESADQIMKNRRVSYQLT